MAKVVSDEILKLKIIVNGDDAQKRVTDLEQANKKLSDSISAVKNEQKKLSIERKSEQQELRAVKLAIEEVTARINARSTASKQLDATLVSLQRKEAELKQKTDQSSAAFAKNKNEIAELTTRFADNKTKIDAEIRSMDIMSLTTTQLTRRMNDLKFSMANMNPNTAAYRDAQADMQRLTGRMNELRTGANGSAFSIGALADRFNRYQGIAVAATATLAGVALSLQQVIDLNNKLADAQTTVSKTTGMNKVEVDELTKSFSEFNTRSSRMDLLKISEIGGRLGVPKEEIKDFTREVDKAFVALGDGFTGGVEAVANKLGKIKGLFKETKDLQIATAMNQIGSAMNELGAAGAASEENIAEFALRVGSLPDVLKPTIADALALGAAFEEGGIDAERSGTAYANFISTAAKNTKGFSEVMRIPQQQVKDMINSNPTEFFLKFAEGLKGLDATELASVLEHLKLNDQYVKSILGDASANTERYRKTLKLSNEELIKATSLQKEFNQVNNNAAAIYEKVRKTFLAIFTSDTVAKFINFFIERIGKMIGAVDDATGRYTALANTIVFVIKILSIAAVSILSYNAAVKLTNLIMVGFKNTLLSYSVIQKVNNFLNQAGVAIQNLVTSAILRSQIAYYRLRGATELQAAAQQRLNLITKASPFAAVIAVVMALTVAYFAFRKEVDESIKKRKILEDINKEASQSAAKEISQLDQLYKKATDVKVAIEDRTIAAKKLLELYPEQFKNQSAEIIMNGKAESSYLRLRDSIIATARAKAAESKLEERAAERLERDEKLDSKRRELEAEIRNPVKKTSVGRLTGGNELSGGGTTIISENNVRANAKYSLGVLDNLKKANKIADDISDQFLLDITAAGKIANTKTPGVNGNYKTDFPDAGKKDKKTQAEKDAEAALKAFQKSQEDLLKAGKDYDARFLEQQSDYRMANLEMKENGYDKELAILEEQLYKERLSINKNINTKEKYDEVDKIISKSSGKLKIALQKERQKLLDEDSYWNSRELQAMEKSELLKKTLKEKFQTQDFKKKEENFQKELELLERQKNEEIASYETLEELKKGLKGRMNDEEIAKIKTWAEGKEALNKVYQQRELTMQIAHMEVMIAMYESLDLSILSKDQQEQVLKFIDDAKNGLAKLKATAKGKDDPAEKKELSLGQSTQTDILGMSPDNWVNFFKNLDNSTIGVQTVSAAINALQQASALYYQFVEANEKRQLQQYERATDKKKRALKTQLQSGYINQETYKKLDLEADRELDLKKAELEYNAAKRQKQMAISQVITSTALGIMNIWATTGINPIMAAILTGVVGALGLVQLGTIIAQPLPSAPGAEEGYYPTIRQQDGKLFNARRKRSSTGIYNEPTMLVGEGGASMPELVVSGRDLKRINPSIQRQYMQEISRVKGFEDGLYPNTPSSSGSDEMLMKLMMTIDEFREVMQEIKDYGIEAKFAKTARNGKDLKDTVQRYEKIENKSKH